MKLSEREQITHRLRWDTPFYARTCLKIIDKSRRLGPFIPNPAQLDFDRRLEQQRATGAPVRALVLKARQLGFSTWVQAKLIQRVTQLPHHDALVIAQDVPTAGSLFEKGELMHAHLPADPALGLKPAIESRRRARFLKFGQPSKAARLHGHLGLNSSIHVDTANEFEAGRGQTKSELHCSEVAFWPDARRKLTGLLSTVPDDPDTIVVLESTANGFNHWKSLWDNAEEGRNEYTPCFYAWFWDPQYSLPFASEEDRAQFISHIGLGAYGGVQEEALIERFDLTPEQLHWRRRMINDPRIDGRLDIFQQEYPATAEEAFLAEGKQVFSMLHVSRVIERAKETEAQVQEGILRPGAKIVRKGPRGAVEVPIKPEWVPREATGFGASHAFWRVWEQPVLAGGETPAGQYIIGVDPSSGEETEEGNLAYSAIEVIDHRTRRQVAEFRAYMDPGLFADQAYLAALYYNRAWLCPETTGGYGISLVQRAYLDYAYPYVYERKSQESRKEHQQDRLGWDTNRATKVVLEDGAKELLREESDGIRSLILANEFKTYIRDPRGKTGPEPNHFSDCLMAWMIAQQIALEKPVRPQRKRGEVTSTSTKSVVSSRAGY